MSGTSWIGLWEKWSCERCSCPWQWGWNQILMIPPKFKAFSAWYYASMIQNKACHFPLCMAPRKAVVFWVHSLHSLMTALHSLCVVWTHWAQKNGYSTKVASESSPMLTIPAGLFLYSFFLRSIQTVPLFTPMPLLRVNRTSPNLSFPWYTACLWLRWNLQQSAHTHQLVAGEHLFSMIDLVPFLSEPEFINLMDSTSITLYI